MQQICETLLNFAVVMNDASYEDFRCKSVWFDKGVYLHIIGLLLQGFLCDPDPMSWADAMQQLLNDSSLATSMGIKARAHVQRKFSRVAMGQSLGKVVEKLVLHVGDAACKEE